MCDEMCKFCSEGLFGDYCDICLKSNMKKCEKYWEEYNMGCNLWAYGDCENCNNILKLKKPKKKKFLALWYSVSPPRGDDYTIEKGLHFIKKVKKFVQTNSIQKACYAFEWKYKDDNPNSYYGIHCHMLLFGDRGKINQHIARQPEKFWNLNPEQRYIIYDEELIKDKIDYFTGHTWDATKNMEKQHDCSTRRLHSLFENAQFKNCDFGTFGVSSSNNSEVPTIIDKNTVIFD